MTFFNSLTQGHADLDRTSLPTHRIFFPFFLIPSPPLLAPDFPPAVTSLPLYNFSAENSVFARSPYVFFFLFLKF